MNINETMEFINSFSKSGKPVTDLSRAENLMQLMGNPERSLKFVHIAGTNGKGSTVEYISNALIYSGYKVGQFTSPFVLHYADRIRINGEEINENSLCKIAGNVKERIIGRDYSQFEITMAIAMLWFAQEKCDIVVLEAGIGGLLDCTNVIEPPLLAVITSISLDHTAILGDTVEKIAEQKAGIIKKNSAVVLSTDNCADVKKIVRNTAKKACAELVPCIKTKMIKNDDIYAEFSYKGKILKLSMPGLHQKINAVTAITACEYLRTKGFKISEESIERSIETTQVKARCQYIDGKPPVIVDGGHNMGGIESLELILRKYAVSLQKKIYTVMGMIETKDYKDGVYTISRYSNKMFTVDGFAPNAVDARRLAKIAEEYTDAEACSSLDQAVKLAKRLTLEKDGIMVVCGSLYLASEYLNAFENNGKTLQK